MKVVGQITACVFTFFALSLIAAKPAASGHVATMLTFRGTQYEHRWSKRGQNEFTPKGDIDLTAWNDMVTLNVHETVTTGEQLAGVAKPPLHASFSWMVLAPSWCIPIGYTERPPGQR